MATWFQIQFTGEPTEADFERVAELAAQGCTSGQLINEPDPGTEPRKIIPGTQFEHAHYLASKGGQDKARCTVTAIRHGRVYWTYTADYDRGDHKGLWYFKMEDVLSTVGRWL